MRVGLFGSTTAIFLAQGWVDQHCRTGPRKGVRILVVQSRLFLEPILPIPASSLPSAILPRFSRIPPPTHPPCLSGHLTCWGEHRPSQQHSSSVLNHALSCAIFFGQELIDFQNQKSTPLQEGNPRCAVPCCKTGL